MKHFILDLEHRFCLIKIIFMRKMFFNKILSKYICVKFCFEVFIVRNTMVKSKSTLGCNFIYLNTPNTHFYVSRFYFSPTSMCAYGICGSAQGPVTNFDVAWMFVDIAIQA